MTVLSRHISKTRGNVLLTKSGDTARMRNANNVIYFLLSKFNRLDSTILDLLPSISMFCNINLRHLYFIMNGDMHGHSRSSICRTYASTVMLNTSTGTSVGYGADYDVLFYYCIYDYGNYT